MTLNESLEQFVPAGATLSLAVSSKPGRKKNPQGSPQRPLPRGKEKRFPHFVDDRSAQGTGNTPAVVDEKHRTLGIWFTRRPYGTFQL